MWKKCQDSKPEPGIYVFIYQQEDETFASTIGHFDGIDVEERNGSIKDFDRYDFYIEIP